jgi:chromosome segregation ATPase
MTTIRTVIPYAPKEKTTSSEADMVDRTGSAIFEFVKHAGVTTETHLQEVRDVAEKLADQLRATRDQLRAAHDQINALKADVRRYQDRANRAEKWLHQISSEIEQRSRADEVAPQVGSVFCEREADRRSSPTHHQTSGLRWQRSAAPRRE